MTGRPAEETEVHTRILRLALGVAESRDYWANVDPSVPAAIRNNHAFEQRWFGAKSPERVRSLMAYFAARYDRFPEALAILRRWREMEPATRQVVCHWHLQLSDPLYRRFTGGLLVERRGLGLSTIDRDVVLRWVADTEPGRWSTATQIQFASKLLSAAGEAGLVSAPNPQPRRLVLPRVSDAALTYFLRVFDGISCAGRRLLNPYLASVGLEGAQLEQRLRTLPGLAYSRMGDLTEFQWAEPRLESWAEGLR